MDRCQTKCTSGVRGRRTSRRFDYRHAHAVKDTISKSSVLESLVGSCFNSICTSFADLITFRIGIAKVDHLNTSVVLPSLAREGKGNLNGRKQQIEFEDRDGSQLDG